jgi:hypothetical protein
LVAWPAVRAGGGACSPWWRQWWASEQGARAGRLGCPFYRRVSARGCAGCCLGAQGGEFRGWRVATNTHRRRRRGKWRGGPAGGVGGRHARFGTRPEGDPLGGRAGHHHGSRLRDRPTGGSGCRGQGGGMPGAAWCDALDEFKLPQFESSKLSKFELHSKIYR